MISVSAILPNASPTAAEVIFLQSLADAAEEVAKAIKRDYEATTETWNTKPHFQTRLRQTQDATTARVFTTSDIYRFVHDGTNNRFVVLTSDFQPKTIPGFIGSFPGRGGVKNFTRRPQPGIIARKFTDSIIIKQQGRMLPIGLRHLRKAIRASGYAYP